MIIDCRLTPAALGGAETLLGDCVAVPIDVLRSTSTIVTALSNGCYSVFPAVTENEVRRIVSRYAPRGPILTAGERNGLKISGFDLGNSPLEFTRSLVQGKSVVLLTSNGTRALRLSTPARAVLVAGFLNASAVAERICDLNLDCIFVCAGTRGHPCVEDTLCAGLIAHKCVEKRNDIRLTARAQFCIHLYRRTGMNPKTIVGISRNAAHLRKLGYENDIHYCLRLDEVAVIPMLTHGVIIRSD